MCLEAYDHKVATRPQVQIKVCRPLGIELCIVTTVKGIAKKHLSVMRKQKTRDAGHVLTTGKMDTEWFQIRKKSRTDGILLSCMQDALSPEIVA